MRPIFEIGAAVRVIRNVRDDGTFPGSKIGAPLVRRGSVGFVRDVGAFLQDQIIYSVHFLNEDLVVGCREEELQDESDPWIPSRFEFREKVRPRIPLGMAGKVLVEKGTPGEVVKVLRDAPGEVAYHVLFTDRVLQVPEGALESLDPVADETVVP